MTRLANWLIYVLAITTTTLVSAQLANRAEPLAGLTTSGQPDAAELESIAEQGYVAVIDLRAPDEDRGLDEGTVVEQLGMRYVSLPVAGTDGVTYDNASALDRLLGELEDAGPVLLHCSTGNRAGALLALRARLNGASAEDAMTLGERAGVTAPVMRETVEQRLQER